MINQHNVRLSKAFIALALAILKKEAEIVNLGGFSLLTIITKTYSAYLED